MIALNRSVREVIPFNIEVWHLRQMAPELNGAAANFRGEGGKKCDPHSRLPSLTDIVQGAKLGVSFERAPHLSLEYNADWEYPVRFENETCLEKKDVKKALLDVGGSDSQGGTFIKAPL